MFYLRHWSRDNQFPDKPKLTLKKMPMKREELTDFIKQYRDSLSGTLRNMEITFNGEIIVPRGRMDMKTLHSINFHLYQQTHHKKYNDIYNKVTRKYSNQFVKLLKELPIENASHLEYVLEHLRIHPLPPKPLMGWKHQGYWQLDFEKTKGWIQLGIDEINRSPNFKDGDNLLLKSKVYLHKEKGEKLLTLHTTQTKKLKKIEKTMDITKSRNELSHFYNNNIHDKKHYSDIVLFIFEKDTGITINSLMSIYDLKYCCELLFKSEALRDEKTKEMLGKVLLTAKASNLFELSELMLALASNNEYEVVCNNWIRENVKSYPKEMLSNHSKLFMANKDYVSIAEMLDMELGSNFEDFVWACREYYEQVNIAMNEAYQGNPKFQLK